MMFLGESNGDWRFWGKPNAYWCERQAFLLGAKFDAIQLTENGDPAGPPNRALSLAIEQRDEVGWWHRKPVYLDLKGITSVPGGIDVRRFRGKDGEDLLVIDNWDRRPGLSFEFLGRGVAVPERELSIVIVDRASGSAG